ncbi:dienelactone hydrolase family protein [Lysinibacillus sp. NPDC096418]|uniref:dienelactone hydrolase family protein n=1 Tax=Lysinibacillus sp. NPDC096418 TaxID=3364138 RepID=UPI00382ADA32
MPIFETLYKNYNKGDYMHRKIFILHEIYGVNEFIKEQAIEFSDDQTVVECVALYSDGKVFPYLQEKEAYDYFTKEVGFNAPLLQLSQQLRAAIEQYQDVILIGFSVGATLAWRLSTLPLSRVVCVYGSHIRQYLDVQPSCPTLVLLPGHEKGFNVNGMKHALQHIHFVQTMQFVGEHGFMDEQNYAFHLESALQAHTHIKNFI